MKVKNKDIFLLQNIKGWFLGQVINIHGFSYEQEQCLEFNVLFRKWFSCMLSLEKMHSR